MNKVVIAQRQARRAKRTQHKQRLTAHGEKLAMLRAMLEHYEALDTDEAREQSAGLKPRIRTLEQQIRYMKNGEDEIEILERSAHGLESRRNS